MKLAPPPFWRTPYFERSRARPDRIGIADAHVLQVLQAPTGRAVQPDGRIRLWGYIDDLGRWLRVVVLEDGVTVHNAFLDRNFRP